MLAFHHHSHEDQDDADNLHPWQEGHAAPEDRAVGLELQLIELVHQRDTADAEIDQHDPEVDAEIDSVLNELAEVELEVPAV